MAFQEESGTVGGCLENTDESDKDLSGEKIEECCYKICTQMQS